MKVSKMFALALVAGLGISAGQVMAQSNDQSESETPAVNTEETTTDGTETEPYNETVTIDDGSNGSSTSSSSYGSESGGTERKERLRVYSGKQDGNNVISDPR